MYFKNLCLRFRLVKICNKSCVRLRKKETSLTHPALKEVSSFRVNPWQMLLLGLLSVAMLLMPFKRLFI